MGRRRAGKGGRPRSHTATFRVPSKATSTERQFAEPGGRGRPAEPQVFLLGGACCITEAASSRLPAPSALPALALGSLLPTGTSVLPGPQCPGLARLQLASSIAGGGRRTGWAVWEGHFSSAHWFSVSNLSPQGPVCCAVSGTVGWPWPVGPVLGSCRPPAPDPQERWLRVSHVGSARGHQGPGAMG